ncbi:hypothetical protein LP419_39745 [Massilia sp. H-1]|nr:hypothetical protein LP419_39745 [Massilia sp. H-1]
MEALDVDGLEGNDHFFIQSTRSGVITTIIGGKGADTFDVARSDVTETIVSLDLEGRSSVINHGVTSDDPAYDNLLAPGVGLNVATPGSGQVVIEQSDNKTVVNEQGETIDSYTIHLANAPVGWAAGVHQYLGRAHHPGRGRRPASTGDSMLVSLDGVHFSRYLVLTANDTSVHTVWVKAVDDGRSEGERIYAISHSTQSADPAFNHVAVKNVRVTVQDNDYAQVIVTGEGYRNLVLEGAPGARITDTYTVALGKPVVSGTVSVVVGTDGQVLVSSADPRYNALTHTLTFDSTNWNIAVLMTVTAVDDGAVENTLLSSITHTATNGYASAKFDVQVVDNDSAGVLIDQSNGSTIVVADNPDTAADEATTDTYTVRLTKAPTHDVTITMQPDDLATTTPLTLTFTTLNWMTPQTVTVRSAVPLPIHTCTAAQSVPDPAARGVQHGRSAVHRRLCGRQCRPLDQDRHHAA